MVFFDARPAAACLATHTKLAGCVPQKYIDLVAKGDPDWENHEAFENYKEEEAEEGQQ